MTQFINNVAYSFSTYPPAITTKFKNAIVLGTVTYTFAKPFADLSALHAAYYPYLPEGTPDDPSVFEYLMLQLDSGATTVVATAWIKPETITRADSFPVQVLLPNVSPSDIPRIRDMLTVNGFTGYQIKNNATQQEL